MSPAVAITLFSCLHEMSFSQEITFERIVASQYLKMATNKARCELTGREIRQVWTHLLMAIDLGLIDLGLIDLGLVEVIKLSLAEIFTLQGSPRYILPWLSE